MPKTRARTPKKVREQVLKKFRHRCAICGGERPQLHHIDEDPANNDPLNLIPLCPNCHILDQHDPTAETDQGKLRLLRKFRDPAILKPQFHPLFIRLRFLDEIEDDKVIIELEKHAKELIDFVANLEMGKFYSKQIGELIKRPIYGSITSIGDYVSVAREGERSIREPQEYREILRSNRNAVLALVIELLRFQMW